VGRTCSMYGGGEVFTGFWLGGLKGRDHWENQGIGERITLRWTLGK
jgi:predicted N-acetyltransferase YhbS